jgi:transcriptional regulator with XRE-family HTH domain
MGNAKAEERLGLMIRQLREERNMSVRMLASLTDFSPSFISQVENGQASPSISSLERIALALGVSLREFFELSDAKTSSVVRVGERPRLESGWSKGTLESLTTTQSGWLNPLIITLQPEGASGKRVHSTVREEFAFILEGEVILTLIEEESTLQRGDAVTIPANTPRRWRNDSPNSAQILVVSPRP